jgi:hypothetical protein
VTSPDDPHAPSVTVECPTCHERFAATVTDVAYLVACTFCDASVTVPSQKTVEQQRQKQRGPTPESVGEYSLAIEAPAETSDDKTTSQPKSRTTDRRPKEPQAISLECPVCHELNRVVLQAQPGRSACTFCESPLTVPDRRSYENSRSKSVAPRSSQEIGEYAHGPVPQTVAPRAGNVLERMEQVRQEQAPPPPHWTFFSGVFNFPWRSDTIWNWLYMTFGFALMLGICMGLRFLFAVAGGMILAAAVFLLLPLIWVSFFTLSYTLSCSRFVFEETSNGHDRIEVWPEPTWRDWMVDMMAAVWIGAIPFAISYGTAKAAAVEEIPLSYVMIPMLFFLYPISYFSALEANSIWVPITLPILRSLIQWWWCWLLFYLLSGAIVFGTLALAVYQLEQPGAYAGPVFLLAPVIPAATIIYFRLLGRLAWRMTAKSTPRQKRS